MRGEDGRLRVIVLGEHAPASTTDFFVLNVCRARGDAVLTSAAILRAESVSVSLQGPWASALADYRKLLGKQAPLCCAIMTRTGELPLVHPIWQDDTTKLVLTTRELQPALAARLGARAEVLGIEALDARTALASLHGRGMKLVSVEAGPSTTGPLHRAPSPVRELLLSLYEGPSQSLELGGALAARLLQDRVCVADARREEQSGAWRFQRWLSPE